MFILFAAFIRELLFFTPKSNKERSAINFVHDVVDFEAISDRILFELKLGRQASAYKAAHKALNRFIQEIKLLVDSF